MVAWHRGLVVTLLLAVPAGAQAWGWRHRSAAYPAYYYAPVVVAPAYPAPAYAPPPVAAAPVPVAPAGPPPACVPTAPPPAPYSPATPAPPSGAPTTREPPLSPGAGVTESRYFDAYPVERRAAEPPAGDRCVVQFWNLSGRELTLTVGADTRPLGAGANWRVEVPREFVWRVADREAQRQKLPPSESALDVVIRR